MKVAACTLVAVSRSSSAPEDAFLCTNIFKPSTYKGRLLITMEGDVNKKYSAIPVWHCEVSEYVWAGTNIFSLLMQCYRVTGRQANMQAGDIVTISVGLIGSFSLQIMQLSSLAFKQGKKIKLIFGIWRAKPVRLKSPHFLFKKEQKHVVISPLDIADISSTKTSLPSI